MARRKRDTESIKYGDIDSLTNRIERKYGKNTFITKDSKPIDVAFIPTGVVSLDCILGGGIPRGRIIEVYGPESSGKSTFCLHAISKFQRLVPDKKCMFIDAEYAYDKKYSRNFKVNVDDLILVQPNCGEEALGVVEDSVGSGCISLIVVDSVAALVPKAEIEGEMGDSHMGLQARLMSQALRKISSIVSKNDCTVIFINQIRMKIGVMWGNPETTTGGNALKFYSSQRIDVRRRARIPKDKDTPAKGIVQKFKMVKNKVAPPFGETEVDLIFHSGYAVAADMFNRAVDFGIIEKNGSWYNYEGEKLGQGDKAISAFVHLDKKVLKKIKNEIIETYREQLL